MAAASLPSSSSPSFFVFLPPAPFSSPIYIIAMTSAPVTVSSLPPSSSSFAVDLLLGLSTSSRSASPWPPFLASLSPEPPSSSFLLSSLSNAFVLRHRELLPPPCRRRSPPLPPLLFFSMPPSRPQLSTAVLFFFVAVAAQLSAILTISSSQGPLFRSFWIGDGLVLSHQRNGRLERWGGFESLDRLVTGAYAGYSAVFLKGSEGKLFVGESGHENEKVRLDLLMLANNSIHALF